MLRPFLYNLTWRWCWFRFGWQWRGWPVRRKNLSTNFLQTMENEYMVICKDDCHNISWSSFSLLWVKGNYGFSNLLITGVLCNSISLQNCKTDVKVPNKCVQFDELYLSTLIEIYFVVLQIFISCATSFHTPPSLQIPNCIVETFCRFFCKPNHFLKPDWTSFHKNLD